MTRLRASRPRDRGRLENEQHLVVLQGQVHRERPLFLPGKGIVEIVMPGQRTVNVTIVEGRLGKTRVVLLHECRQERITGRDGIDAA